MPESVVHFQIRMPPALHERLASLAMERKESLNVLIVDALRAALEARTVEQADGVARG
jgi:predicted HicB family RNase H-like nuclease